MTVIRNWTFLMENNFFPDLTKEVQEVIFSRKTKKLVHPCLSFNDILLKNSIYTSKTSWVDIRH